MRSDIVSGGVLPDYELPDHTNTGNLSPFHGWYRWSPERIMAERVRVAS